MIPLRKPSAFHLLDSCLECICLGLVVFLQIEEPIVLTSFAVLADQFLLSMAVPLLTLYLGLIWSWQDNWAVVAAAVVVQECHGVGWRVDMCRDVRSHKSHHAMSHSQPAILWASRDQLCTALQACVEDSTPLARHAEGCWRDLCVSDSELGNLRCHLKQEHGSSFLETITLCNRSPML